MADVTRRFFLRHLRGTPTLHIRHQRGGKLLHDGAGLSFWYRPLSAVVSEVPIDDRELPLLFHARTADYADVTVQATVTFRVTDPALAAARVDFSLDPDTGRWRSAPLEQLSGLVAELAQQPALDLLGRTTLAAALTDGVARVRETVGETLAGDARLAGTGISVIGVRVVAIRPEADVDRALQTPTRESIQQEADRATYERRALAVERERAIAENELQNKIELARRAEQLLAQEGANARRQAEERAASEAIEAEGRAARERVLAGGRADAARTVGVAEAAVEEAKLAAYAGIDRSVLYTLALRELAGQLPQIGSVTVTPDMLTDLVRRLG
ncbi:MAG: SPFH domain-containing protein [Mycobacteriales bacterium]